jgi:hypothetical protein
MGWVINTTYRPIYPRGKGPGIYCTGGYKGQRAGLTGVVNFIPTEIRTPDLSARRGVAIPTTALSNLVEILQEKLLWGAAFFRIYSIRVYAGNSVRFWLNPF